MGVERIEIKPGYFIEVSDRLKLHTGMNPVTRLLRNNISLSEREAILQAISEDKKQRKKYPPMLVDEGVKLFHEVGMDRATKLTGLPKAVIYQRNRELNHLSGTRKKGDVGMEIKIECVRLATAFERTGKYGVRQAFAKAGLSLRIRGLKVMDEWKEGLVKLPVRPSSPRLS
jgi:hypothetical protein